ncbi:protein kinase family protein [Streptomyces roseirectus]|uniref:Protein kinase family protein n=1 Tax=Streptomyces roseirectus TaxID=2768066 RepID=A0A7H0IS30_9ACTN|nr:protein kinase family protein [Streptomyces roseirectus]
MSAALARLDDAGLTALLDTGTPLGTGVGGATARVEVAGHPVFVKRLPLADAERHRSTADVFGLPPACHYGIGAVPSPGFGAWRELEVYETTTRWAVSGRFPGFPLLRHARVLPATPADRSDAYAERAGAYWGPAVRARVEARATATANLLLFLEYVPQTLHDWLRAQVHGPRPDEACALVDRQLTALTDFLGTTGLVHFDTHFRNVLTDGRRLYLTDHGLALSTGFDLTPRERAFHAAHRTYDDAYTRAYLARWLVTEFHGGGADRLARLRAYADGARPEGMPDAVAGLVRRHAAVAAVMEEFESRLGQDSSAVFPAEAVHRLRTDRGA